MYCPNCGKQISEKAEICPKCGVRPFRAVNYCYHCGEKVNENQEFCVSCGVAIKRRSSSPVSGNSDPLLMALLSFILPGLGQIISGQIAKGIVILFVHHFLLFVLFIFWFITAPLAIIDAYFIARKKQEGKTIGEWEFF